MKKQIILFFGLILFLNSYSQITFEKGYYIDNYNKKIDCLIKNIDWANNPDKFEYKLTDDSKSKTLTLKMVKEFGIYNESKYISQYVDIDRSSDNLGSLSSFKNPVFKKEHLFLKVLVEGKANLYSFKSGDFSRFFFSKDNLKLEQLIYKRYNASQSTIGKNNRFRQQLFSNLKCQNIVSKDLENVDYVKNDLVKYFINYNDCNESTSVVFGKRQEKNYLNLNLRVGLNNSSLTFLNTTGNTSFIDVDFGRELNFRISAEAEFIFNFNKNKWAILLEPTYTYFKSKKALPEEIFAFADYKSIEIPIGLRHYMFLNKNSKIFINASFYLVDFTSNSKINFERNGAQIFDNFEIDPKSTYSFGIGYNYNNKYSIEFRYDPPRDFISTAKYPFRSSEYENMSLIFGYTIF